MTSMRRALFVMAILVVGCSSREERDAVSTTTLTSASLEASALVGESRSALRVNLEQSPAKLTLHRKDRVLAFRADGAPSSRVRGALEFAPSVIVITKDALEEAYDGDPARFVETFGQTVYGDPEKVAPPALFLDWNAVLLVTEQGQTTAETVSLRKVRR